MQTKVREMSVLKNYAKLLTKIYIYIYMYGEVIRMTQIVTCYKTILHEANLELEGCRSHNIRAKIERQYGLDIEFYKVPKSPAASVYSFKF